MLQENEPKQKQPNVDGEVISNDEVILGNSDIPLSFYPVQMNTNNGGKRKPKESTSQSTKKQRFRKLKDMAELLVRDFNYEIIIFAYTPNKRRGTSFGCAYGENANKLLNEEVGQRWKNEWMEFSNSFASEKNAITLREPRHPSVSSSLSKSTATTVQSTSVSEVGLAAAFKKANDKKARLSMLADNRRRKAAERKAEWAKLIKTLTKTDSQTLVNKARNEIFRGEKDPVPKKSEIQKDVNTIKTISLDLIPEKRNVSVDGRSTIIHETCPSAELHSLTNAKQNFHINTGQEPKKRPKVLLQSRTPVTLKSYQKPIVLKLIRAEEVPQNSKLIEIRNRSRLHQTPHRSK